MTVAAIIEIKSVGIESLDEQHEELANLICELYDIVSGGGPRYEEGLALKAVLDYATDHFTNEQELLQHYGYPHAGRHADEHGHLLDMLTRMVDRARSNGPPATPDAVDYLSDWFCNHVAEHDLAYSGYLRQRGVG